MEIKNSYKYDVEAIIFTGENIGSTVFILRIISDTAKNACFPFMLYENEFPYRLALARTINKSQGQDFRNLGL